MKLKLFCTVEIESEDDFINDCNCTSLDETKDAVHELVKDGLSTFADKVIINELEWLIEPDEQFFKNEEVDDN